MDERICDACRCKFTPALAADTLCIDCEQNAEDAATVPTPEEIAMADRAAKRAVENLTRAIALSRRISTEIMHDDSLELYALDISLAMNVIEAIRGHEWEVSLYTAKPTAQWHAQFTKAHVALVCEMADTPEEAICLAAIKLVDEGVYPCRRTPLSPYLCEQCERAALHVVKEV